MTKNREPQLAQRESFFFIVGNSTKPAVVLAIAEAPLLCWYMWVVLLVPQGVRDRAGRKEGMYGGVGYTGRKGG